MNKQIIISLSIIAVVAAVVAGGTVATFFDTEKNTGNTITAGVVDIVVNDHNPWESETPYTLLDMKPCITKYIEFTVRNIVDSNPVRIWKHIDVTDQNDGYITEPECTEGNGTWNGGGAICTEAGNCCTGNYEPRNNLAAYIIYDMYVCPLLGVPNECETDANSQPVVIGDWTPIITEDQHVRLDNVSSAWIYLGELEPGEQMRVVQSYHLRSWPDAPEPEVTNWAQGDELTFDIELYAEQLGGYGPKGLNTMVQLDNKVPDTWEPTVTDGIGAVLSYKTSSSDFEYSLFGTASQASTEYCLIYYADPYPGSGTDNSTGALIDTVTSNGSGTVSVSGSIDLATDLPNSADQNYPAGAKVWLVPCSDYDQANRELTDWNPLDYLMEMQFINYDDTDV